MGGGGFVRVPVVSFDMYPFRKIKEGRQRTSTGEDVGVVGYLSGVTAHPHTRFWFYLVEGLITLTLERRERRERREHEHESSRGERMKARNDYDDTFLSSSSIIIMYSTGQ